MPTTGNNTLGTGQYIQIGFSFRYLSKPELVERLHSLKHQNRISKLKIDRLKAKLTAVIKNQSISLDQGTSDDMMQMMLQQEDRVAQFPEGSFQQVLFQIMHLAQFFDGSFQQVFFQQQKDAALKSDKRGIRWHPLFIKWCLYLHFQSAKAYDTLRQSGCIQLPSSRTLQDYSNCVQAHAGFSLEVDLQLYRAASLESCEDWQKFVCLLLDEMYVRENLVYNKSTGRLVGFCDLGEVNNHLLAFERSLQDSGSVSRHPPLAKTIMVIMVRGLFTPLRLLNLRR